MQEPETIKRSCLLCKKPITGRKDMKRHSTCRRSWSETKRKILKKNPYVTPEDIYKISQDKDLAHFYLIGRSSCFCGEALPKRIDAKTCGKSKCKKENKIKLIESEINDIRKELESFFLIFLGLVIL